MKGFRYQSAGSRNPSFSQLTPDPFCSLESSYILVQGLDHTLTILNSHCQNSLYLVSAPKPIFSSPVRSPSLGLLKTQNGHSSFILPPVFRTSRINLIVDPSWLISLWSFYFSPSPMPPRQSDPPPRCTGRQQQAPNFSPGLVFSLSHPSCKLLQEWFLPPERIR